MLAMPETLPARRRSLAAGTAHRYASGDIRKSGHSRKRTGDHMSYGGTQAASRARTALAACALAGLLAIAGCGSSGSAQPSWAKALGSGVTVDAPGSPAPGNDSPDAVVIGVITAVSTSHYTDFCKYEQPSQQSQCNSSMSQMTPADAAKQLPTFKNIKVGYSAIDGRKALIGTTGTICVPNQTPSCYTNNNPAAIFDSGKSFSTLWSQAVSAAANVYSLAPAVKVNGSWYAYTGGSS
jgi:hypothetical protein